MPASFGGGGGGGGRKKSLLKDSIKYIHVFSQIRYSRKLWRALNLAKMAHLVLVEFKFFDLN